VEVFVAVGTDNLARALLLTNLALFTYKIAGILLADHSPFLLPMTAAFVNVGQWDNCRPLC
jgi:hypothetical protein